MNKLNKSFTFLKSSKVFFLMVPVIIFTSCTHLNKKVKRTISSESIRPPHELNVSFEISHKIASQFEDSEIKEIIDFNIGTANECLRESFKGAGSDIQVNVSLGKLSILSQEDLKRIGYNPYQPDRDQDGNIIPGELGAATDHHIVRYFDAEVSHATYLFNKYLQDLVQSEEFKPILLVESYVKRVRDFKVEWGPVFSEDKKKELEQMEKEHERNQKILPSVYENLMQKRMIKLDQLLLANIVRMDEVEFLPINHPDSKEAAVTFTHELMHSYGGLDDNYIHPENTAPNLMGAHGGGNSCILTPAQVERFIKYRSVN